MELLSGGEMLVRALHEAGVEYIYGYPGGSLLHVYDALYRQSAVKHVLVRHEQAAAHMADGYARATGKPGVVMVTSGPGATNTITGIATAFTDSVPMVVISGQVMSFLVGDDAFQETDMLGVSRPIVKHSFAVTRPEDIPELVAKAFHIASTGRPGPVVIDIPKDMTMPNERYEYAYPKKVKLRSYTPPQRGHSGQIKKAVDLLLKAKRPVIYSGGGVILDGSSDKLRQLVDRLNAPCTNTLMGLGAYPGTGERFVGMLGMHGSYEANMTMHHADVILAIGARFDDRVTGDLKKFSPHAKIIHIDIDPASIGKNVAVEVPIVGDAASALEQLLEALDQSSAEQDKESLSQWWGQIESWRSRDSLGYDASDEVIKPQFVVQKLHEVTLGDAFVTSDVGQHQMWAAQYYGFNKIYRRRAHVHHYTDYMEEAAFDASLDCMDALTENYLAMEGGLPAQGHQDGGGLSARSASAHLAPARPLVRTYLNERGAQCLSRRDGFVLLISAIVPPPPPTTPRRSSAPPTW